MTTMETSSLPTDPEALARLLGVDDADLRARLAVQEGTARADRLLDAAQRRAELDGPSPPRNRGGRPPVGDHEPGQRSRAGSLRLEAGVIDRLDRLAAAMTLERIRRGEPRVTVSRNDVVRAAVAQLLAKPPKPGVIVQYRPKSGSEVMSFIPGRDQNRALDRLSVHLSPDLGRGRGRLERSTLIRWAVDEYLGVQEGARNLPPRVS